MHIWKWLNLEINIEILIFIYRNPSYKSKSTINNLDFNNVSENIECLKNFLEVLCCCEIRCVNLVTCA